MIKLSNILSELELDPGSKFVEGDYIVKTEKDIEEIKNLIGLEVTGDFGVGIGIKEKFETLPQAYLKVGGDLGLNYTSVSLLPNDLKVEGNLFLSETKVTSLPDNLEVGGDLILFATPITSLPNNLKVGRSLELMLTPLADKYSLRQIRRMLEKKGGKVGGKIRRA